MESIRERIVHPALVWLFLVAGVALDALVVGGAMGVAPLNSLEPWLTGSFEEALVFLGVLFLAISSAGFVVYLTGLDPFRAERPLFLVYLNALPVAGYVAALVLFFSVGPSRVPSAPAIGIAVVVAFGLPAIWLALESMLAGMLLALGRRFDERGSQGAALFCLKAGLRWRPGVHETARRCGLLLMELGRYKAALKLLGRLEPLAESRDPEVLEAIERAHTAEGNARAALEALRRRQAVRPVKGLDEKILARCLELGEDAAAIEILESGGVELDARRLETLFDLYRRRGDRAKARECARRIASREAQPFPVTLRLLRALATDAESEGRPDESLRIEHARLMLRTGAPDLMDQGAEALEAALARAEASSEKRAEARKEHAEGARAGDDPTSPAGLRRALATHYRATQQWAEAARHFERLLEEAVARGDETDGPDGPHGPDGLNGPDGRTPGKREELSSDESPVPGESNSADGGPSRPSGPSRPASPSSMLAPTVPLPDDEAELHVGLAESLEEQGLREEALAAWERMRARRPGDWRPRLRSAEILSRLGRLEAAHAALADFETAAPPPESARLEINMLRTRLRNELEEASLRALSEDMGRPDLPPEQRLVMIERLLSLGRGDQAVDECDRLLEAAPEALAAVQLVVENALAKGDPGYRMRDYRSDLLFRQGRFDEALEAVRSMAEHSLQPDAVLEEGCRRILARAPAHAAARRELAETLMRLRRWREAESVFAALAGTLAGAEAAAARRRRVQAAAEGGDMEAVASLGTSLLDELPEDPDLVELVVRAREALGEHQSAHALFAPALERFPDHPGLAAMRLRVIENRKRDRLRTLAEGAAAGTLTAAEHYEKADLHRGYGQTHEAIVHYQRAAEDEELHVLATVKLAICLCERRLFTLADETLDSIELTKDLATRSPELKAMYYWLADTMELELYKEASMKYFKRLFRVDASFRDVVIRLERLGGA